MMDAVIYKFDVHQGLPPEGEAGYFFGFDADNQPYIMRWSLEDRWVVATLSDSDASSAGFMPFVGTARAAKIVSYSPAPLRWSALGMGPA